MTDHRHERPTPDDVLADALRDAAPDRFAVGFTGRVTERLARERANVSNGAALDFTTALERHFIRIVPLLAAASLILAIYGWWGGRSTADSLLDATLRLPQVSIATVYTPEALYGEDGGGN